MKAAANWVLRWRVRTGYPVALAFLLLAHPTTASLAAGATVAALGLLVRGAAAGYLHKHEQLATGGPYAFTRNPLYLGSSILALGFVVAGASWIATAVVAAYFVAFYPAVMGREEAELKELYGATFEEYSRRVPRFWPRLAHVQPSKAVSFAWAQYRRNREYQAGIGTLAGFAILASKPFLMHFLQGK